MEVPRGKGEVTDCGSEDDSEYVEGRQSDDEMW